MVVHGSMIVDSITAIIADLNEGKHWPAYEKLKHLVDSLFPLCYTMRNGDPIQSKADNLKIQTELNDFEELDALRKNGKCRVQIDLINLHNDLEKIRYQLEKNKYLEVKESLEGILVELKKLGSQNLGSTDSKYEFQGKGSDLILQARTELNKMSKTLFARFVEEDECKKLLEKYIVEAYIAGRKDQECEIMRKNKPIAVRANNSKEDSVNKKPAGNDFNLPPKEKIVGLFKDKSNFVGREEMINLVYRVIAEPGLLGLDYSDIKNIFVPNSKFRLTKTFLNEISEYQTAIDDSAGVFVVFTCGPEDTLGFVNEILEDHFHRAGACVPQCFIDPKVQSGNPKLEIILGNR